jgi:hypothetical protein
MMPKFLEYMDAKYSVTISNSTNLRHQNVLPIRPIPKKLTTGSTNLPTNDRGAKSPNPIVINVVMDQYNASSNAHPSKYL